MGQLPLNRLQSLRDRIPHGVNCIHTARDYYFVIASINNTAIDPIAVALQTQPMRARLHRAARDYLLIEVLGSRDKEKPSNDV